MSEIVLSTRDLEVIRCEGEAHYPEECCGFLFGILPPASAGGIGETGRRVTTEVLPIANTHDHNRSRRFLITPGDFLRAESHARATDQELLGFYHTHPDHPAIPSEFDREHALPFYSYVILSVQKGLAAELRSWQLNLDRSGYAEEMVKLSAGATPSNRPNIIEAMK